VIVADSGVIAMEESIAPPLRVDIAVSRRQASNMSSSALRVPAAPGVNVMLMVQLAEVANAPPQLSVSVKSAALGPLNRIVKAPSVDELLLESTNDCVPAVGNERLAGESVAGGAAPLVTVSAADPQNEP
jgi:hypothetical protein